MGTLCKPNFMFLGGTVFEKNAMISCKNSKLHNSIINNFEFYKLASHFSPILCTEELEIFFVFQPI